MRPRDISRRNDCLLLREGKFPLEYASCRKELSPLMLEDLSALFVLILPNCQHLHADTRRQLKTVFGALDGFSQW